MKTLLVSGAAGCAVGVLPLILGAAQPTQLLITAAASICGGLVTRAAQRSADPAPADAALPPRPIDAASAEPTRSALPVESHVAVAGRDVARDLVALEPLFSVTHEQLLSIVAQTEDAAGAIMMSLEALNAAQMRSAGCIADTRERIVGFAEQSDTALHTLAQSLGTYLDGRLRETRAERSTVDAAADQMRGLDTLIVSLEKVGASTRMLALNANIEASRAGIHGAGFKVIARELQDLAQASQAAMAEARAQVSNVQRTIAQVLTTDHGAEGTHSEQQRLESLMTELDGIARTTTQVLLGMVRTDLAEIASQTSAVGDQVLSVFGQVQFQDVVRQQIEAVDESNAMLRQCLDGLRQGLIGAEPAALIRPTAILETVRSRYVTQIQHRVDAQALGKATAGTDTPDIELF
ncbi:Methyl-accepting chemotaxis protein (MCP) signalling domain-containing protein [Methylobacterium phyllostachyos]|uniref:Methyl-accepting chemotaxis protein (MCP) signalling domain-containing protein n=1 Tax=Methylobacterium phyllostachyos TaxID=582672 RepID=A0A1G9YCF4_9HYPH|nr:methyl-accepting chemotaxis protein [Methylobacterium phyllostachyos]SDN06779.1 Methyl-accepting chemotaxis protein (MCP) signalling domain-containing protein [Methylobacterium phyllostachyos]